MKAEDLEAENRIIFATLNPVLFSSLQALLGLSLEWGPWKLRVLEVQADGVLSYKKTTSSSVLGKYDLTRVQITQLESGAPKDEATNKKAQKHATKSHDNVNTGDDEHTAEQEDDDIEEMNGIVVKCSNMEGYDTCFRVVLGHDELHRFYRTVRTVSDSHNLDNIERGDISDLVFNDIHEQNIHAAAVAAATGGGGGGGDADEGGRPTTAEVVANAVAKVSVSAGAFADVITAAASRITTSGSETTIKYKSRQQPPPQLSTGAECIKAATAAAAGSPSGTTADGVPGYYTERSGGNSSTRPARTKVVGAALGTGDELAHRSAMRHAVAKAMDMYDVRTVSERVVARRGAFRWLPVLFSSDLVHGAWWFVAGSVLFVAAAIALLVNARTSMLGDDDSRLPSDAYISTLALMIISGAFYTLGSMAFVRALQRDPPLKPLFSWYHLQSDELLGSWLFLLGTTPMIPYSLMYLSASDGDLVSLCALSATLVLVFALSLLVKASYPSNKPRHQMVQPIAYGLCHLFCSRKWMRRHMCNDWLVGCWVLYWTSAVTLSVISILFAQSVGRRDLLNGFIYGTGYAETTFFLIGSAYFVAGSYPPEALLSALDDDSGSGGGGGGDAHSVHSSDVATVDFSKVYRSSSSPSPHLNPAAGVDGAGSGSSSWRAQAVAALIGKDKAFSSLADGGDISQERLAAGYYSSVLFSADNEDQDDIEARNHTLSRSNSGYDKTNKSRSTSASSLFSNNNSTSSRARPTKITRGTSSSKITAPKSSLLSALKMSSGSAAKGTKGKYDSRTKEEAIKAPLLKQAMLKFDDDEAL